MPRPAILTFRHNLTSCPFGQVNYAANISLYQHHQFTFLGLFLENQCKNIELIGVSLDASAPAYGRFPLDARQSRAYHCGLKHKQ
jgi:hypothetical protein